MTDIEPPIWFLAILLTGALSGFPALVFHDYHAEDKTDAKCRTAFTIGTFFVAAGMLMEFFRAA